MTMNKTAETVFGILGAVFLSALLIPQIYLTFKTKNVDGLSIIMLILQFLLNINYLSYGIITDDIYLIIANCIATVLSIILLILWFVYKKNSKSSSMV